MIKKLISCFALTLLLLSQATLAQYQITPAANWVQPLPLTSLDSEQVPIENIADGTYYRLLDDQFQVDAEGKTSHYIRYVMLATNQTGVEGMSQLNLDYNPSYQRIELHHLQVIRDGLVIDKLASAQLKLLQRELDADKLIYDGSQTLNIILDDIRPGDTLDYAFTRVGRNPIYQGLFSYTGQFNWSVPVAQQQLRILWQKDTPLQVHQRQGELPITRSQTAAGMEYKVSATALPTKRYDSQTPSWYDPYNLVFFTEFASWQQVVDWALPMYQKALSSDASVENIAAQIRSEHASIEAQVGAALKYTQDEIRYLGLEMGSNSHQPTAADETLRLRYGDCKDKTVVLMSILRALGIESHPALVNTELNKGLAEIPPASNRFDHVLVTLEHQGQRYWLDPTTGYQTGTLDNLSEPNFGYALIVKEGEQSLTSMVKPETRLHRSIVERYELPQTKNDYALFSVQSTFSDSDAIDKRQELANKGLQGAQENYTNYYQNYFAGTEPTQLPRVEEGLQQGEITVKEYYRIGDFWQSEDDGLHAYFYADDIQNAIYEPEVKSRTSPLFLRHPYNVDYRIEVHLNEHDWHFNNANEQIDNPFYRLDSQVRFEDNVLILSYQFRSKVDHVTPQQVDAYLAARKELLAATNYGIRQGPSNTDSNDGGDLAINALIAYVLSVILVLTIFITLWRIEASKRPSFADQRYFPVSSAKFYLYSVISLGIFPFYWCYKNWQFIQRQNDEAMMPIARGFFAWIWFYPLYARFYDDSEQQGTRRFLPPKWLAVVLAIIVVALHLLVSLETHWLLGQLLWPLPWLPLVSYTARLNKDQEALRYHSHWRPRQLLLLVIFLPLLMINSAYDLGLTPSLEVIPGDKLWQHDKHFMVRQGLLDSHERLIYFYSDATWNIRNDGNGVTEQGVFSYYRDNGQLQKERAAYVDIADVKTSFADDSSGYTVVDIERMDGSSFRLILSAEEGGDSRFVNELKRRWQLHRL
ncbi:DUF3857 domain-containing transglutaminase family protein [Pseudoalteromonas sp. T1lg48]|uniref:DUF3857 domain-containing transglutaminase family protein n=1 Tax=Pseudoalteromonas sp. T1lg48 TaxID=2077100 RepID=UPI000CF7328E|nr:DUF3857 domain-containing transglutaminase family protein [Pseudoalteromonas sp. T1lg48]